MANEPRRARPFLSRTAGDRSGHAANFTKMTHMAGCSRQSEWWALLMEGGFKWAV